jgi:hypothetical protein
MHQSTTIVDPWRELPTIGRYDPNFGNWRSVMDDLILAVRVEETVSYPKRNGRTVGPVPSFVVAYYASSDPHTRRTGFFQQGSPVRDQQLREMADIIARHGAVKFRLEEVQLRNREGRPLTVEDEDGTRKARTAINIRPA